MDPLVTLIISEPGMAERLLAVHADDGTRRCRVCSGGHQSGRYSWPCAIHRAAEQAQREPAAAGEQTGGSR